MNFKFGLELFRDVLYFWGVGVGEGNIFEISIGMVSMKKNIVKYNIFKLLSFLVYILWFL